MSIILQMWPQDNSAGTANTDRESSRCMTRPHSWTDLQLAYGEHLNTVQMYFVLCNLPLGCNLFFHLWSFCMFILTMADKTGQGGIGNCCCGSVVSAESLKTLAEVIATPVASHALLMGLFIWCHWLLFSSSRHLLAYEWNQSDMSQFSEVFGNENRHLSIYQTKVFPWDQRLITTNLSQGPNLSQSTFS